MLEKPHIFLCGFFFKILYCYYFFKKLKYKPCKPSDCLDLHCKIIL
jgi:hypothetical protein